MGCPCESPPALRVKMDVLRLINSVVCDRGVSHVLRFSSKALPQRVWGLRVADSHTGNCLEDSFTPLETIRKFQSTIGRRSHSRSKGGAKDFITTQTCELSKEEFNYFLTLYPISSEYRVILPKSNQTVFDAPPGYVGLHTHSFSLANHRLPLTEFFCEVLEYFQVHISRLNPFGCAKLTPFVVMCKAYSCEPSVDLFRGFFNLRRAGKWLTFAKRYEKHISNLLPKVITHIKGWHKRFFYVQDSIIPAKYPQLLSEQNKLDLKSFKDKLPPNIEENPMFQPTTRDHGEWQGNFIYTEDDEELSFLPKEPSPGFGTGSPSVLLSTESLKANEDYLHGYGVCRQKGYTVLGIGQMRFLVKSWHGYAVSLLLDMAYWFDHSTVFHHKYHTNKAKISAITHPAWKNHLDNHKDVELHDRCYARQVVVNNVINRRSCELLQVIEKLRGEFDVMRSRERAREEECKGLRVKCEAAMTEFEKNPTVVALREKISAISTEVKEHKLNLDMMMLESHKWAGYQQSLSTFGSRQDRREVVSKFVPYAVIELVHSDDMVKGYRYSYKNDHTQASNDFANATFPWFVPSRTQVPLPTSQRATPSSALVSNLMSSLADASIAKPQSSPL
ncbi:hypothetical protein Tco_0630594 [Tanacetum coccineum]